MRLPVWFVTISILLLALPTPVLAQAVSRADLVGTWVRTEKNCGEKQAQVCEMRLALKSDNTWSQVSTIDGKADTLLRSMEPAGPGEGGHWYLSADSLWLGDRTATKTQLVAVVKWDAAKRQQVDSSYTMTMPIWPPMKAVIEGEDLFLLGYDAAKEVKARPSCQNFYCFKRAAR